MSKLFALTFLLLSFFAEATTITGIVKDNNNKPLGYATVTLLHAKDSSLVKGDVTDKNGVYQFENINNGEYILSTTNIGFQKAYVTISVNNEKVNQDITLQAKDKSIKEVKVVAKKPLIEVKADKTVFNVEQSINAIGTNALDLLRKSPGVRVDKDDNVSMRGKNNVLIYIDGKPTYLDNKDLAALLKNMQSSDIESIEMITNPSAKYDASGNAGIINIKLKKNKKFGTNGNINTGFAVGKYPKYNAGLSLNHRNKKINVFGNYGYFKGKNMNYQNFNRVQNAMRYNFKSNNVDDGNSHTLKTGLDYFVDSKNIVGIMFTGMVNYGSFNSSNKTYISTENGSPDSVLIATNRITANRNNIALNFNHRYEDTSGRTFNTDIDYGYFISSGRSYQPNTYYALDEKTVLNRNIFKNYTPTTINIYTAKADYEQNFKKGKLGVGVKTALVNTVNTFEFYDVINEEDVLNTNRTNSFTYNENVNAAYISYAKQYNTKWSSNIGLRAEQTNSKGVLKSYKAQQKDANVSRHYFNLFPSAGLSYNMNAKNAFSLTYSRRIDRPNYQDLNPFENKLDELTYEKGNAFLKPQYTDAIDFTHTFMQFFTTSLSYAHTKDLFMQTTDTTEGKRTYVTQKNFNSQDLFGLNMGTPIPVKKLAMLYIGYTLNYTILHAILEGRKLDINYTTFTAYSDNTINLPKEYALNISGWYQAGGYWGGTFKMKPMGSLDLGLQKQFLQKKLTAKASVSDILKTQAWYASSNFSGLKVDANGNYESRQFKINLAYRFGNNQVAKQRDRETGASKESGRIKGK